jgi:hypothetical protein
MIDDSDVREVLQGDGPRVCGLCGVVAPAWAFGVYYYAPEAWVLRCLDVRLCEARLMRQQTRDRGCPGCGEDALGDLEGGA